MVPEDLTAIVRRVVNRIGYGHLSVHTQYALRQTWCVCTVIVGRDGRLIRRVADAVGEKVGHQQVTVRADRVMVRMRSDVEFR